MSRQNFYVSGLASVLRPGYRVGRTQLYTADDVGTWAAWLLARRGMIALGLWPANEPLVPAGGQREVAGWLADDDYGTACPVDGCGAEAICNPFDDDGRTWCPVHGIVNQ